MLTNPEEAVRLGMQRQGQLGWNAHLGNKGGKDPKLAIKGEIGEVSEMQLILKKEVEEAPLMDDGQSL